VPGALQEEHDAQQPDGEADEEQEQRDGRGGERAAAEQARSISACG
jgi:hypothetical protein